MALEISDNKERRKQIVTDAVSGKILTDEEILSRTLADSFNANEMVGTCLMPSSSFSTFAMADYVFRGNESIPIDIAEKRIAKLRKKHPEYFEPLEKMKKNAYSLDSNKARSGNQRKRIFGIF